MASDQQPTGRGDRFFKLALLLVGGFMLVASPWESRAAPEVSHDLFTTGAETPLISTRDHFTQPALGEPELIPPATATSYQVTPNVPGLGNGVCPVEMVIYVHGFANVEATAIHNFNTARRSLIEAGYPHPLVGFTWDSDPPFPGDLPVLFHTAESIATQNGPKLAQAIIDLAEICPSTAVRLVSHSLGARVVLNALSALSESEAWADSGRRVASVNAMGAAVYPDEIAAGLRFGDAIEQAACVFHNDFDPQDSVLRFTFPLNGALGGVGAAADIELPSNFYETNVENEVGTNHSAYAGILEDGDLVSTGAIPIVKADWDRQFSTRSCVRNLSNNDGSSGFSNLAVADTEVYVVWEDQTPGDFDVLFRRSTDAGASFDDTINLSNSPGSSRFPRVATDGVNVWVVWTEGREIYMAISTTKGASFGPAFVISEDSEVLPFRTDPRIAAWGGTAFVSWNTANILPLGGTASRTWGEVYLRSVDSTGGMGPIVNVSQSETEFSGYAVVTASAFGVFVAWQDGESMFGGTQGAIKFGRLEGAGLGLPTQLSGPEEAPVSPRIVRSPTGFTWSGTASSRPMLAFRPIPTCGRAGTAARPLLPSRT